MCPNTCPKSIKLALVYTKVLKSIVSPNVDRLVLRLALVRAIPVVALSGVELTRVPFDASDKLVGRAVLLHCPAWAGCKIAIVAQDHREIFVAAIPSTTST